MPSGSNSKSPSIHFRHSRLTNLKCPVRCISLTKVFEVVPQVMLNGGGNRTTWAQSVCILEISWNTFVLLIRLMLPLASDMTSSLQLQSFRSAYTFANEKFVGLEQTCVVPKTRHLTLTPDTLRVIASSKFLNVDLNILCQSPHACSFYRIEEFI